MLAGSAPRRTTPRCDPCPCTTSGHRRSAGTTRSGDRRRRRPTRRPRRTSPRRPWRARGCSGWRAGCSRRPPTARARVHRGLVVVPLVHPLPGVAMPVGGRVIRVLDVDRRARRPGRVVAEVAADQAAVPASSRTRCRPRRGCRCSRRRPGCSPRTPPAGRRSAGRRSSTGTPPCRSGSRRSAPEHRGVLRGVDLEVVRLAERLDGRDALVDRVVPEARRLGEDEHPELRPGVIGRPAPGP